MPPAAILLAAKFALTVLKVIHVTISMQLFFILNTCFRVDF